MGKINSWPDKVKHSAFAVGRFLRAGITALGAALFALASIAPSVGWPNWAIWSLFFVGCILTGAGVWYELRRRRPRIAKLISDRKKLQDEVERLESCNRRINDRLKSRSLDLVKVVKILLRDMAESLDICSPDIRISVYRHDGDSFVLIGRVSENVEYEKVARERYPDNQGFISDVWAQRTTGEKVTLPEDRGDWEETQVKTYRLTPEEARKLRMPTRAMCGARVRRDHHGQAYGVLCVECTKPRGGIALRTHKEIVESAQFGLLSDVLELSVREISGAEVWEGLGGGGALA